MTNNNDRLVLPVTRREREERRRILREPVAFSSNIRARAAQQMPEQVSVLTSLLLRGARVDDFSGALVRVGGRQFLRIHYVAAKRALGMARAARRGMEERGLGGSESTRSLRQLLRGALVKWFGIDIAGRK